MRISTQHKAEIEQRRKQVAANVLAGLMLSEIAEALGVSYDTIKRDWKVIQERWQRDQIQDRQQAVNTDIRRLDRTLNAIWGEVQKGNLLAIDRMVKVLERRAKLLGLDGLPVQDTNTEQALGKLREFLAVMGEDTTATKETYSDEQNAD